jgi:glycerol-3-phosphate dehydrogenase (NAD(P)+)
VSAGAAAAGPIGVLGGGSWGTALARHLASGGRPVRVWVHDPGLAARMASSRENPTYLPGFELPASLTPTASIEEAAAGAVWLLLAVPAQHCRGALERAAAAAHRERPALLVAAKGIENGTLLRVSEVASEVLGPEGHSGIAVLSGPSFAREVAAGRPTAVVAASADPAVAGRAQALVSFENLRVYTSPDVVGVEMGGALKNVVAIAAGVVEGLGLGANTLAALVTRGLAEMTRLAAAAGARRETLAGLSGLGDLVLTCTGSLSRNRHVGVELGRGRGLDAILAGMKMVAEGVTTARSALELSRRLGVPMPITEKVHAVLHEGISPAGAIRDLLARPVRPEEDGPANLLQ